ncbi:hypothetical protein D1BOALGB6SA_2881 [Olavius sp. associated proteobacterium Delta 1]|nr:hypothetical protein D1BOALGB6SA_2881 [Olavius sp. associated proteobacterium Delta 1]
MRTGSGPNSELDDRSSEAIQAYLSAEEGRLYKQGLTGAAA